MPFLFLLFVLVPVVEIALFIRVGGAIGLLPTLAIVLATAALGTWLLRREGVATLARARERMAAGELPASQLVEGLLLFAGGLMLLTPGFMTDAAGFLCLLAPTRRWLAARIAARAAGRVGVVPPPGDAPAGTARPIPPGRARPDGDDVIDGDYERID